MLQRQQETASASEELNGQALSIATVVSLTRQRLSMAMQVEKIKDKKTQKTEEKIVQKNKCRKKNSDYRKTPKTKAKTQAEGETKQKTEINKQEPRKTQTSA